MSSDTVLKTGLRLTRLGEWVGGKERLSLEFGKIPRISQRALGSRSSAGFFDYSWK
jgi:hypothetical protein